MKLLESLNRKKEPTDKKLKEVDDNTFITGKDINSISTIDQYDSNDSLNLELKLMILKVLCSLLRFDKCQL